MNLTRRHISILVIVVLLSSCLSDRTLGILPHSDGLEYGQCISQVPAYRDRFGEPSNKLQADKNTVMWLYFPNSGQRTAILFDNSNKDVCNVSWGKLPF